MPQGPPPVLSCAGAIVFFQTPNPPASRSRPRARKRAAGNAAPIIMTIELTREDRARAVASIERYFRAHMDEQKIGNIAAGGLLGFFLEEIGPAIYNQAVADVQERLQARIAELDLEVHEEAFAYWHKYDKARKARP